MVAVVAVKALLLLGALVGALSKVAPVVVAAAVFWQQFLMLGVLAVVVLVQLVVAVLAVRAGLTELMELRVLVDKAVVAVGVLLVEQQGMVVLVEHLAQVAEVVAGEMRVAIVAQVAQVALVTAVYTQPNL